MSRFLTFTRPKWSRSAISIRPSWKELTSVEWKRRKVVDRHVELPEQLQFTAHPLWRNPEKPA